MPTAPARELAITYGSVTVNPDGQYRVSESFDAFSVEFDFLVTATTESAFATALVTARAAFRKPFQDLAIVQGGQTLYTIKPSTNTGLETRSEILKEVHDANTGRSRRFHVRITAGLPADNVTTSGLREFSYSVAYSASRRRLIAVSGVVTAVSGTAARAQYESIIAARVSTLMSALGVSTYELISEDPTASSYNDKTLTFSRNYHEIKFGQAGGGDDSGIVEQQLRVGTRKSSAQNAPPGLSLPVPGAGASGAAGATSFSRAIPFVEFTGTYDAWIDFSVTTDLAAKWASIRNWAIDRMKDLAEGGSFALTSEAPSYMPDDNKISVVLVGIALPKGSSVVRREFSQTLVRDGGSIAEPAWTGNLLSKFVYQGPGRLVQTTRLREDVVGGGSGAAGGSAAAGPVFGGGTTTGVSGTGSSGGFQSAVASQLEGLDSFLVQDVTVEEPTQEGLETLLGITATTQTRVIEYYKGIAQPPGYGART